MSDQSTSYDPGIYAALGEKSREGDMKAFETIKQGAALGDGYAQLELGFNYAIGSCVKQDNRLAAQWYEKAAAQGVLNAQFNLGCMHYLGQGFERNTKNALHWFEIAAKGGHARAKQNIPGMQNEATFLAQQQLMNDSFGFNKVAGLQDLHLARGYVAELKKLTQDNEVRKSLQLSKLGFGVDPSVALAAQECLTLVRNISSATPLTINLVLDCAIHNVWEALDSKLADNE